MILLALTVTAPLMAPLPTSKPVDDIQCARPWIVDGRWQCGEIDGQDGAPGRDGPADSGPGDPPGCG